MWRNRFPESMPISAATGEGLDGVVEAVRARQAGDNRELTLRVPLNEGRALHFIENRAEVFERRYDNAHVDMRVRIGQRQLAQLRALGASFEVVGGVSAPAGHESDGSASARA